MNLQLLKMTKTTTSQTFKNEYATIEAVQLLSEFYKLQENDKAFILENIIFGSSSQQLDILLHVIERRMASDQEKVAKVEETLQDNGERKTEDDPNCFSDSDNDEVRHYFDDDSLHEQFNLTSNLFQCSHCSYVSNRQQNLKRHVKSIHKITDQKLPESKQIEKVYSEDCPHCQKSFLNEHLKNSHIKDVHESQEMFPCMKCDMILSSLDNCNQHVKEVHDSDNKFCIICKKMVKNLIKHKRSVHTNSFKCELCTYVAPNKFRIKRHLKTHLPEKALVSCHICGKEVVTLDQHLRVVHGPKRFKCKDCPFAASMTRELDRHISAVHLKNKEICPFCGKKFSNDHLSNHIKNKHHNVRDKSCDTCKKTFVTNSELKRHVEVVHNGVRSTCEECGGAFVNVLDHIRKVHKREKAAKGEQSECKYCGEMVFHLKHHILINHDDSVEKVYCELCSFKTLKYSVLKKHITQKHGETLKETK